MIEDIIAKAQHDLAQRILKKYLEPFVDLVFMPNDPKKSLQMVISESLRELKNERNNDMIKTNADGTISIINDEDAVKLRKYDEIVKILNERDPYGGNRETCDMIRSIVKEDKNDGT